MIMDIEKFETITDFQRGFAILASVCVKKFGGDKCRVAVTEDGNVEIEFF